MYDTAPEISLFTWSVYNTQLNTRNLYRSNWYVTWVDCTVITEVARTLFVFKLNKMPQNCHFGRKCRLKLNYCTRKSRIRTATFYNLPILLCIVWRLTDDSLQRGTMYIFSSKTVNKIGSSKTIVLCFAVRLLQLLLSQDKWASGKLEFLWEKTNERVRGPPDGDSKKTQVPLRAFTQKNH